MADLYVNIQNESISVADTEDELVSVLYIDINDSISIAENNLFLFDPLSVVKQDSISISENNSLNIPLLFLDINTDITIVTYAYPVIPLLSKSTYDSISISDTIEDISLIPLIVYDNIYIRDLFVSAIADDAVTSISNTIVSTQTIFSSATRTGVVGTYTSNAFKVSSTIMLRFHFNVTAEVGTATLDSILQVSPDNVTWYDAATVDQITATGQYTKTLINPGIWVRVKSTIAGSSSPSFTYSCKMTKHMINIPKPRMVYA